MLPILSFPTLTGPAAPTTPAAPPVIPDAPLATRCPWNLTIAGKAEYYDAAGTTSIPQTLGEALVLLYICAHPPEHFWQARTPEHEDGTDSALPLGMDPVSLRRDIAAWAARTIRHDEEAAAMALALAIWISGHATYALPTDAPAQKKMDPPPTGLSATSSSSPEETPPSETTCSTACPSAPPTPPSTPDSTPPASIA